MTAGIRAIELAVSDAHDTDRGQLGMTFVVFLSDGRPGDNLLDACEELGDTLHSLGKGKSVFCTVGFGQWSYHTKFGHNFAPLRQLADWAENGTY